MKTCLGKSVNPNLVKPKSTPMSSKPQASVLLVAVFVHALLFHFAAPWDNPTTRGPPSVYCILFSYCHSETNKTPSVLKHGNNFCSELVWCSFFLLRIRLNSWILKTFIKKSFMVFIPYWMWEQADNEEYLQDNSVLRKETTPMTLTELFPFAPAEVLFLSLLFN